MAISKDKKQVLVADLKDLLSSAKLTVFAGYQGLTVAELQELRKVAREQGVKIKVVKNRLVRVAMGEIAVYKDTDTTGLTGQLLYAISDSDEVAPAKILANFAKTHPNLQLVGGFTEAGQSLDSAAVNTLAAMPSRDELIAQVVAQLLSPVTESISGRILEAATPILPAIPFPLTPPTPSVSVPEPESPIRRRPQSPCLWGRPMNMNFPGNFVAQHMVSIFPMPPRSGATRAAASWGSSSGRVRARLPLNWDCRALPASTTVSGACCNSPTSFRGVCL